MDSIFKRRIVCLVWTLICIFAPLKIVAQTELCGNLENAFGPFDYTDPEVRVYDGGIGSTRLQIVEGRHFHSAIEDLSFGEQHSMGGLVNNIDYTLRAFPNHHRAIYAIMRLERDLGGKLPQNSPNDAPLRFERSAHCYLDRAERFTPNDPTVHLLRGIYYHWLNQLDNALAAYKRSEVLYPNSAELKYNMGLLYFDQADYENAKKYAKAAYDLGHSQIGLREKLTQVGQWP